MKIRKRKWRGFSIPVISRAFRDTGIFFLIGIAGLQVHTLFMTNHFKSTSMKEIRLQMLIFLIVWLANCISGAFGFTTLSDNLGEPRRGYAARVPATLAVSSIVAIVSVVILLLSGFGD